GRTRRSPERQFPRLSLAPDPPRSLLPRSLLACSASLTRGRGRAQWPIDVDACARQRENPRSITRPSRGNTVATSRSFRIVQPVREIALDRTIWTSSDTTSAPLARLRALSGVSGWEFESPWAH